MGIKVTLRDITMSTNEAIVNAANRTLLGGSGVDGAIHRAAGPKLLEECKQLRGCKPGQAKITKGYNLKAKYVIHTVGPRYKNGKFYEDKLLANCYVNSLELALKNNIETISFPSISTGIYRYPIEKASKIAVNSIDNYLDDFKEIEIVCFDEKTLECYKEEVSALEKSKLGL